MNYRIYPPEGPVEATVMLPRSKSISNRALVINALTPGARPIDNIAVCDDTDAMVRALNSGDDYINIGAAGTTMRFLTAYFATREGRTVILDGTERMRHRPIRVLVDALRRCGAEIEYEGEEGYPPLRITGRRLTGGDIELPATISSQYISALLMTAPVMEQGLTIHLSGEVISRPYILMTLALMERWGIAGEFSQGVISVPHASYSPCDFNVEADWSASSYWYEMAALSASEFSLPGLERPSVQGDSRVASIFEALGVVTEYTHQGIAIGPSPDLNGRLDLDLSEQPDLAQTIIVTCCMLGIPFHITGLSTLKIKETDRISALVTELGKLSFRLEVERDCEILWDGSRVPVFDETIAIDTYDDHRMAMAFAPCAIYLPGLVINDIEVVTKSYPSYWDDLRAIGFVFEDASTPYVETSVEED
ncbi:MAG: 3-phosphoshikimate 1-carboxyvinyltransferase [Pseudoflavonifractor sp.]|nr:3-phosphoshikimate 1-carboxyvinyltransferase [Pseudoflavonifractor sp.]